MFKQFLDNILISSNQSGFKPDDSCINQLIAITYDIFKSFDGGLELRGVSWYNSSIRQSMIRGTYL